jgi:GT2 family glycosyltransferase
MEVGGVAGRVLNRGFPMPDRPAWKSHLPWVGWLFFNFAQTQPCEVWTARGCHMSFRRSALEAVGGFDEGYVPWPASREETDLCFRLRQRGWRLLFEPRATVEHLMHASGGERVQHRDSALSPTHHANALYFVWKNVPARHRPLTLLVLLIQELRRRPPERSRRSWRERRHVLGLFLQGVVEGRRRARRT